MNILKEDKSIIKIVMIQFCMSLNLYKLIWSVIYCDKGYSIVQIGLLFSCYYMAKMLLEIPSGFLADRYSKKKILILSELIIGLYLYVLFYVNYNILNVFAMVCLGISYALISGTLDAFEYDIVANQNKHSYKLVNAIERVLNYLAFGISYLSGGLFNNNRKVLFIASEFVVCISVLILCSLEDIEKTSDEYSIKACFQQIIDNKRVREPLVVSCIIAVIMIPIENYLVFIMQEIHMSIVNLSVYEVLVYIFSSLIGVIIVRKLKINYKKATIAILFSGICLALKYECSRLLGYLIIMVIIAVIQPFRTEDMQNNIISESRSMFLSIESILISISGIVGQNVFSIVMDKYGICYAILAVCFIGRVLYIVLIRRNRSGETFFGIRRI